MISPEQTRRFLQAVTEIRLERKAELYWAARVCLLSDATRIATFDAAFHDYFNTTPGALLGAEIADSVATNDQLGRQLVHTGIGDNSCDVEGETRGGENMGRGASGVERLRTRYLEPPSAAERAVLDELERRLHHTISPRASRRFMRGDSGDELDWHATIGRMPRTYGEISRLEWKQRRKQYAIPIVLIDISGSMSAQIRPAMMLAYALTQAFKRTRCFTLGTRLTDLGDALHSRDAAQSFCQLSERVDDWQGGTRLGPTLLEFVQDFEREALVRGARVLIISDGLERGDPSALYLAVHRIKLLASQLTWCSPLARRSNYEPRTRAMRELRPTLGQIFPGSQLWELGDSVLRAWCRPGSVVR